MSDEKEKTTLQDYKREIHSGLFEDNTPPFAHPRSEEIHNPKKPHLTKIKDWFDRTPLWVFWAIPTAFAINMGVEYYNNRDIIDYEPVKSIIKQIDQIEVIRQEIPEVAYQRPKGRTEARRKPAWKKAQTRALEQLRSNERIAQAQIKSQEKVILNIIKGYYAAPDRGKLCVTWAGETACRRSNDPIDFNFKHK